MTYSPFPWSDLSYAMLKKLWERGRSAQECADAISGAFGIRVSRNAIIGQCHRRGYMQPFGTNNRVTRARTKSRRKQPQKLTRLTLGDTTFKAPPPKITAPAIAPVADEAPVSRNITLFQLNGHTCRWPYGDGKYTFCGAEPEMQSPYCAAHTSMAYHGKRT